MEHITSSMTVLFFSLFIALHHPLMLILCVVSQTILTSWFMSQLMQNSWLSLILILIFLGGLLIIFIYLSSMVPNETMTISMYAFGLMLLLLMICEPTMSETKNFFSLNISLFSSSSMNFLIPLILMYMLAGLATTIFMSSLMKAPSKQELN